MPKTTAERGSDTQGSLLELLDLCFLSDVSLPAMRLRSLHCGGVLLRCCGGTAQRGGEEEFGDLATCLKDRAAQDLEQLEGRWYEQQRGRF